MRMKKATAVGSGSSPSDFASLFYAIADVSDALLHLKKNCPGAASPESLEAVRLLSVRLQECWAQTLYLERTLLESLSEKLEQRTQYKT